MTMTSHILNLQLSTPQPIIVPGGLGQGGWAYLHFNTVPSAGSVLIQGIRPGGGPLVTVYSGPAAQAVAGFDSGYASLRVTFTGITGGAGASLNIVNLPTAAPPSDLLTDGGFGKNRRLRVDPGQTGFFSGHMFRTFHEFSIAAGGTLNILFQSPINFILWGQQVEIDQGAVKVENITSPTISGTWTALPNIGRNRMTEAPQPLYVSQMVCQQGGTLTAGTIVDAIRLRTAPNQGNSHSSNIVNGQDSERGVPAGNYGVRISALAGISEASLGTIHFTWEERP